MYAKVLVVFAFLLALMVSGMASSHSTFVKHHAAHVIHPPRKLDSQCRKPSSAAVKVLRVGASLFQENCSR